jgi:hypothetical protein
VRWNWAVRAETASAGCDWRRVISGGQSGGDDSHAAEIVCCAVRQTAGCAEGSAAKPDMFRFARTARVDARDAFEVEGGQ